MTYVCILSDSYEHNANNIYNEIIGRSVTLEWGPPKNAHEPGRLSGACMVTAYEIQMREGIFPWLTAGTGIKGFACKKNNLEPGREYGFR